MPLHQFTPGGHSGIKRSLKAELVFDFSTENGGIKSLQVPSNRIDEILDNEIMFDGSTISGFRDNETLDLRLYPDKSTFLVFPFKITKLKNTARLICDIYNSDGTPFAGCPRSNLKRVIENAKQYGYTMQVGPEVEFFLFKTDGNNNIVKSEEKTGYYDVNLSHSYDEALSDIMLTLGQMGFCISALHHEGAPYQYEIDLGYDEILKTADKLITFKFVTKIIAKNFGFMASFMPKPVYGQNGSGLHLNVSLTDKNSNNAFYNPDMPNSLSNEALYSIGSLLKNIKGISAIFNPTINSYKRLVKDYEAPIYVVWSAVTRSALVRIPAKKGDSTRFELRSPDFSMNPYLAFAVLLQTCMDGLRNKTEPPVPVEKNLFLLSSNEIKQRKIKSLPRNLFTALEEFEKCYVARIALGDYIFENFLSSKQKEWNDYRKQVTPWETKRYLDI